MNSAALDNQPQNTTANSRPARNNERPRWWGPMLFVLYAWGLAAPFWILVAGALRAFGVAPRTVLLASLLGVLLAAPASACMRAVASRLKGHRLGQPGEVAPAFAVAILWFFLAQGFGPVPFLAVVPAALAFIASNELKRWRNRRRDLRAARRIARPKVVAADRVLDSHAVLAALDSAENALSDPAAAKATLHWIRTQVAQAADPGFQTPQPFRVAAGAATAEIEARIAALKLPASVGVQALKELPLDRFIEPVLFTRMAEFVLHYAVHHDRKASTHLELGFEQNGGPGFAVIRTNLERNDLWFLLPTESGANAAKLRFVETLNRFAPGQSLETGNDSAGKMIFRLSLRNAAVADVSWDAIERSLPEGATLLSDCPHSGGTNRTYRAGNRVIKVAKHSLGSSKPVTLAGEYQILRRLDGVSGAPQRPAFESAADYDSLSYNWQDGALISEYLRETPTRSACFRSIVELSYLLEEMHERGVAHRDLMPDNVLVDSEGAIHLIDFDQGTIVSPAAARALDFRGEPAEGVHPCRAFARDLIPALGLQEQYASITADLRELWTRAARSNANSPGQEIAYYAWTFGALELRGERPWRQRWQLIRGVLLPLLKDARVLDLGCNMGMLSLHCLLSGAARVTGVDLQSDIVECATQLCRIAGVEFNGRSGDLNDPGFVADLGSATYDVAIALSVVHWLENKTHVLDLLSRVPVVLFEGHLTPTEEIQGLRELGFSDVKLIGYSDRLRGLYLARKS